MMKEKGLDRRQGAFNMGDAQESSTASLAYPAGVYAVT